MMSVNDNQFLLLLSRGSIVQMLLILLSFFLFGCGRTSKGKELKLAHGLNTHHPVHLGMEFMADKLYEISEGQLSIAIYPNQQLGTERQCLELLQIGSLAMTKVSAAVMENFSPKMSVFSLPYIFRDKQHAFQVQDSPLGKELLLSGEPYALRGLAYFDAGSRSFYTKEPIRSIADFKGKKLRVQESATAINLVKALGGAPTPISWGELYTALQQGVVDGAENNPPSFYSSRHYEVCRYYTLNEHTVVPDILVISTHIWKRLSTQEQAWLTEAARHATTEQRRIWELQEKEALEFVEKAGVEIIIPDKRTFSNASRPLLEAASKNAVLGPLINKIRAIQ